MTKPCWIPCRIWRIERHSAAKEPFLEVGPIGRRPLRDRLLLQEPATHGAQTRISDCNSAGRVERRGEPADLHLLGFERYAALHRRAGQQSLSIAGAVAARSNRERRPVRLDAAVQGRTIR